MQLQNHTCKHFVQFSYISPNYDNSKMLPLGPVWDANKTNRCGLGDPYILYTCLCIYFVYTVFSIYVVYILYMYIYIYCTIGNIIYNYILYRYIYICMCIRIFVCVTYKLQIHNYPVCHLFFPFPTATYPTL